MTIAASGIYTGEGDAEISDFHYSNAEFARDPHPVFEKMRRECPVAHSERYDGFWVLSKYSDVLMAYQEPRIFSSFPNPIPPSFGHDRPMIPVETDPPDLLNYRRILMPLFTPQAAKALEPRIRATARALVTQVVDRGGCEYISSFAKPLPTRLFLDLVGWPQDHADLFLDWADKIIHGVPGDDFASQQVREESALALYTYFAERLDDAVERQERGQEDTDLLSVLLQASFGGERPLTQFEILDIIFLVLIGGLDTVQAVLGLSMEYLASHEVARNELVRGIDDQAFVESAVEELLRWCSPVSPGRTLTEDVEVRGVQMHAGDRVMLLTGSAGRDEDEFPHGEIVDFRRHPNRHLAFGAGAHRCLGSNLARLELRVAMEEWHRKIPAYRLKEGTAIRRHGSAVRGVDELVLQFD